MVSDAYSAEELIVDIQAPTLIVHSQTDKIVPFEMGQTLAKRAQGNAQLWTIDGKHVNGFMDYSAEYLMKINSLLRIQ